MTEPGVDEPQTVVGTLITPLLGVTFEPGTGEIQNPPNIRIVARDEPKIGFAPWDDIPDADNQTLASATHVVELRDVTLLSWPDDPRALHLTEETHARLTDLVAMLSLETKGFVTYAEAATAAPLGNSEAVEFSFVVRDFASRLDAVSMFDPVSLSLPALRRAVSRWQQLPSRHPSLRTAAERLLLSWQRERYSHDKIVDFCIAIEALVGEGSDELVNRISLRTAAMLATIGWGPSSQTARAVREIYSYRSQVVHGVAAPYKKQMISVGDGPPVHAVRSALAVLLGLLKVTSDTMILRLDGSTTSSSSRRSTR